MSRSGRRSSSLPVLLNVSPNERKVYVERQLRNAELFLSSAEVVNKQPQSGHIVAILLYDCFECLITAAVAHVPHAPIYDPKKTRGIHNQRREQFEQLYRNRLPPEHSKLSFIIKNRNALRYIDLGADFAPWEIRNFQPQRMQRYVDMMRSYLQQLKQLCGVPYPSST